MKYSLKDLNIVCKLWASYSKFLVWNACIVKIVYWNVLYCIIIVFIISIIGK